MTDSDDEYRFYPEDFEGDDDPTEGSVDAAPLIIVACLGAGGLLFLADPLVGPIEVFGVEFRTLVASAIVIAAGLLVGSSVYIRRGRRILGYVHAFGGLGWVLVVLGTLLDSPPLLVAGAITLVVGAVAIVVLAFYS